MKTFLQCTVTRLDGSTFSNPLQLKEAGLISQLAKDAESVLVVRKLVGNEEYDKLFLL